MSKVLDPRPCACCGVEFVPRSAPVPAKYCSNECRKAVQREQYRYWRANNIEKARASTLAWRARKRKEVADIEFYTAEAAFLREADRYVFLYSIEAK